MPRYPFMQVDAFADRPLHGNPCAILFDTDEMDAETMQAIARENNLSETVFVRRSSVADFGVRYFTPGAEIPLAGHPTIATTWALIESGRIQLPDSPASITLELQVGPIRVDIERRATGSPLMTMTQKRPEFLAEYRPEDVLPVFGLSPDDALPNAVIQTVSTGTPQLMVPLRNQESLRRARIDAAAYERLHHDGDFFCCFLFCLQGFTAEGRTSARCLDVPPDLMEDPFTGSATGGMAAYLWRHGLIDDPTFVAEQGHGMNRPGQAMVEVLGPRDNIEAIKVGGTAVTLIRGELEL